MMKKKIYFGKKHQPLDVRWIWQWGETRRTFDAEGHLTGFQILPFPHEISAYSGWLLENTNPPSGASYILNDEVTRTYPHRMKDFGAISDDGYYEVIVGEFGHGAIDVNALNKRGPIYADFGEFNPRLPDATKVCAELGNFKEEDGFLLATAKLTGPYAEQVRKMMVDDTTHLSIRTVSSGPISQGPDTISAETITSYSLVYRSNQIGEQTGNNNEKE